MLGARTHPALVLVLSSGLAACGGAGASGGTTLASACAAERTEAERMEAELQRCRASNALAPWVHQERYDHALFEVRALQVLAPQRAISAAEAQDAADAYWELLDAVSPELTAHAPLDRAENAAEAMLRDRTGDAAVQAAQEAEAALAALRSALLPEAPPDPCAEAQTRADVAAAAASACAAP
ncbi:MAG: hypothetical protein OHK0013_16860 [Sandaracinaceae bacterium]